jgi:predicted ATPase
VRPCEATAYASGTSRFAGLLYILCVKLQSVSLTGLFEDRDIDLDLENLPSIAYIYGENGSGKSTVLRLIGALFDKSQTAELLTKFELQTATLKFSTGEELILQWAQNPHADSIHSFSIFRDLARESKIVSISLVNGGQTAARGTLKWPTNSRDNERVLRRILGNPLHERDKEYAARQLASDIPYAIFRTGWDEELTSFFERISVCYIGTERISPDTGRVESAAEAAAKSIFEYIEREVAKQGRYTNQKTIEHLARLVRDLSKNDFTPTEDELSAVIRETLALKDRLTRIGLLGEDEATSEKEVELLLQLNKSEMSVKYWSLWYELYKEVKDKLAEFEKPARRIEAYVDMVGSKLLRKRISVSPIEGVSIKNRSGDSVPFDHLSSGEQHLFVLYYQLIFQGSDVAECNLVLIDEPELSMNFDWLREFTDDLERIIDINESQFVLATHSPFIGAERPELRLVIQCEFLDDRQSQ